MISVSGCMFLLPGQLFLLTTPHVQGPPVIHPLSGNLQCTTARSKGASGVRGGGGGGMMKRYDLARLGLRQASGSSYQAAAAPPDLTVCREGA